MTFIHNYKDTDKQGRRVIKSGVFQVEHKELTYLPGLMTAELMVEDDRHNLRPSKRFFLFNQ